ncbi:MAG: GldG family protein [Ruminococcus sp.]|uniref:GldG family protein n=1 Tax=Ruminococcus sp. TaxID=41978 RepID=UPI0025F6C36B|nr:GldG family protein [Ruminococcus sp.]MCR5541731.1 GldG family protein [Ruminococcus sp.]
MAQKETTKPKKSRGFTAVALIFAAISLAIVVLINLMVTRLNITWDLTPTKIYKLTDSTTNYLKTVDKKVNFYFLQDMDQLSTARDYMPLYNAMNEYSSYDCINFEAFDPDSEPDKTKKLQELGFKLSSGDIVVECEGRSKRIPAYTMFESHSNASTDGKQSTSAFYFTGENRITGAIEAVVTGRETKIYFLTGHGEKSIDKDYTKLKSDLAARNYIAETLDLTRMDSVPDDAVILILAAPQSDILDNELKALNDYLDRGGNICFWMSPNEAELDYVNIDSLLKEYNISMDYDYVEETDPDLYSPNDHTSFYCSIVVADETTNIDITSGLREFTDQYIKPAMIYTRSFDLLYGEGDNSTHVFAGGLLETVDKVGDRSSTAIGQPLGGAKPRQTLGNNVLELAVYSTDTQRSDSKVMAIGNAEFIDDENYEQVYSIIPINLQRLVFSWMYDSELALDFGIGGKEQTHDEMSIETATKAKVTIALFIAVPVVVGLIGGAVWLKRRYTE